jgi:hypothetical protein
MDQEEGQNQTLAKAIQAMPNFSAEQKAVMASNPDIAKAAFLKGMDPATPHVQKIGNTLFQYDSGTKQWVPVAKAPDDGARFGLNPQYGTDKDGNPVLVQVGDNGTAVQTKMPDGVTLSKAPIKLDVGDAYVLLDPITRQPIGKIAKNNEGEAEQKAVGKAVGEARAAAPQAEAAADELLRTIDMVKSHPGREAGTGLSGTLDPRNYIPGTNAKDFQIAARQLKGQTFLQAFNTLRGGGQITEIEGQKATDAIGRLDSAQSDAEYVRALDDLRGIVERAKARAQGKADAIRGTPSAAPTGRTSGGLNWSVEGR